VNVSENMPTDAPANLAKHQTYVNIRNVQSGEHAMAEHWERARGLPLVATWLAALGGSYAVLLALGWCLYLIIA
jgi:hypothetical protein